MNVLVSLNIPHVQVSEMRAGQLGVRTDSSGKEQVLMCASGSHGTTLVALTPPYHSWAYATFAYAPNFRVRILKEGDTVTLEV